MKKKYYVYMLQCADQSFYVGVTNSIDRRLQEHKNGKNMSCYTYKKRPLTLVFCAEYQYINDAIDREKQIKKWTRKKKEALMIDEPELLEILAQRQQPWTAVSKLRSHIRRRITRGMLRDALAKKLALLSMTTKLFADARAPQHDNQAIC
jgi:putative endonuclease